MPKKTTSKYANLANPVNIPVSEPLDSRQSANNGGGFTYTIDKWNRLNRFLILGADSGTYYVGASKHARQNVACVRECIKEDGLRVVQACVDVSVNARAPKQDHAIYALSMCANAADVEVRRAALSAMSSVCRTGTTFFQFIEDLKSQRSLSGQAVKRALRGWYNDAEVDKVAYQVIKYGQRNNWTHRDVLEVCHAPGKSDRTRDALYGWIVNGVWPNDVEPPHIMEGFFKLQEAKSASAAADIVVAYRLPREAVERVNTEWLNSKKLWEALLVSMPLEAMIRNLPKMTELGLLSPTSNGTKQVLNSLTSENLHKSKIHPIKVLYAYKTYERGHGVRSSKSWTPVQSIVGALDNAFYEAFKNVVPTGKSYMVAVDCSGSMDWSQDILTAREAAAAMTLLWLRTERIVSTYGFSSTLVDLRVNSRSSLKEVLASTKKVAWASTNIGLPIEHAIKTKENYDVFVSITDNEVNSGKHPSALLKSYRRDINSNAKLLVLGVTATNCSIADPNDPGMLDIAGFDASVPTIAANFALGKV